MQCSAEIRWFWKGDAPAPVDRWFKAGPEGWGGGGPRTDKYIVERAHHELGLKIRDAKPGVDAKGIDVKGLVAVASRSARFGTTEARVELWTKWTSSVPELAAAPVVTVHKTRLLRKLDTSTDSVREVKLGGGKSREDPLLQGTGTDVGCNIELTEIGIEGSNSKWTTLGFEAFAFNGAKAFAPLDAVEASLRRALDHLAAPALDLSGGLELSYPAWLTRSC
jgi:hypothetical protein